MADDDEIEISEGPVELSREDAAARLRSLADELARRNGLDLPVQGRRVFVKVPDRVRLGVEVERGEDGTEIEIEIRW